MPIDKVGDKYRNKSQANEGTISAEKGKWGDQQYVEGEQRIGAIDGGSILNPLRDSTTVQSDALAEAQAGRGMGTTDR